MKLSVETPHGVFTRTTTTPYTHVVVRSCERSQKVYDERGPKLYSNGVTGRWIKDRGYAVTWHKSERAARDAAAKPYVWAASTVLGIYAVGGAS